MYKRFVILFLVALLYFNLRMVAQKENVIEYNLFNPRVENVDGKKVYKVQYRMRRNVPWGDGKKSNQILAEAEVYFQRDESKFVPYVYPPDGQNLSVPKVVWDHDFMNCYSEDDEEWSVRFGAIAIYNQEPRYKAWRISVATAKVKMPFKELSAWVPVCDIEWELTESATGEVGVSFMTEKPGGIIALGTSDGLELAIEYSGSGMIDIGGGEAPAPVTPVLAVTTPKCKSESGKCVITNYSSITDMKECRWYVSASKKGSDMASEGNSYAMSGTGDTRDIKWLKAGTYWVNAYSVSTGDIFSKDTASMQVIVNDLPEIDLIADKREYCHDETINLTASSKTVGTVYTWKNATESAGNNNKATVVAKANTVGNNHTPAQHWYYVSGAAKGCSSKDSVRISANPQPVLAWNPDITSTTGFPGGSKLETNIVVQTGGTATNWLWSSQPDGIITSQTDGNVNIITPAVGGATLSVEVTNNFGCKSIKEGAIINNGKGLELDLVSVYGNKVCINGSAVLVATVKQATSQGKTYRFDWYKKGESTPFLTRSVVGLADTLILEKPTALVYHVVVSDESLTTQKEITLTRSTQTAVDVETYPTLTAATSTSQVVLWARPKGNNEAANFDWQWQPQSKIVAGEDKTQFPLTRPIAGKNNRFDVFMIAKGGDRCVSTAHTNVRASLNLQVAVQPENSVLCLDDTLTLRAIVSPASLPGLAYQWEHSSGLSAVLDRRKANVVFKSTQGVVKVGINKEIVTVFTSTDTVTARVLVEVKGVTVPVLRFADIDRYNYCVGNILAVALDKGTTPDEYVWRRQNSAVPDAAWEEFSTGIVPSLLLDKKNPYNMEVIGKVTGACSSKPLAKSIQVDQLEVAWTKDKQPPLQLLAGATLTGQVTVEGGSTPYTYTWTKPTYTDGTSVITTSSLSNFQVEGMPAGSYTYELNVVDNNKCKGQLVWDGTVVKEEIDGQHGLKIELQQLYEWCGNGYSAILKASATGGSGSYTCKWRVLNLTQVLRETTGLLAGRSDSIIVQPDPDQAIYEVEFIDEVKNLRLKKSIRLTPKVGVPIVAVAQPDMTIEAGHQAVLWGGTKNNIHAIAWRWQPVDKLVDGEDTRQFPQTKPLTAEQTYQLYAISAMQCVSAPASTTVHIDAASGFTVTIASVTPCKGSNVSLTATCVANGTTLDKDLVYSWKVKKMPEMTDITLTNAETAEAGFKPTESGKYEVYVKVTNTANGKSSSAKSVIDVKEAVAPEFVLQRDIAANWCNGDTIRVINNKHDLAPVNTYMWKVDGKVVADVTGDRLEINGAGTHTISVSGTSNGCQASETTGEISIYSRPVLNTWSEFSSVVQAVTKPYTFTTGDAQDEDGSSTAAPYTYKWTKPEVNDGQSYTFTPDPAESEYNFEVFAFDTRGCRSAALIGRSIVESGDLTVEITSKYGNEICTGGGAVLVVSKVTGYAPPYTFEWFNKKDDQKILGTDSILLVSDFNPADPSYAVRVTRKIDGGDDKLGIAEISLSSKAGLVPEVEVCGGVITIPRNTQAALSASVTKGTAPYQWTWSPDKMLVAGEASLRSPMTKKLAENQLYRVCVEAGGCVSNPEEVQVNVTDDQNALAVTLTPLNPTTCRGNHILFTARLENGTTGNTVYRWTPMEAATRDTATYAVDNMKSKERVVVTVTNGGITTTAASDITIYPANAPVLSFIDADKATCAGSVLIVENKQADAPVLEYNWLVNNTSRLGDRYVFDQSGTYDVRVVAKSQDGCFSDTLKKQITIQVSPKLLSLSVVDSCGEGRVVAVTDGKYNYSWESVGGTITLPAVDSICLVRVYGNAVLYTASVVISADGSICTASGSVKGKAYSLPSLSIASKYKYQRVHEGKATSIKATVTPYADYPSSDYYTTQWSWLGSSKDLIAYGANTDSIYTAALRQKEQFVITVANIDSKGVCILKDTATIDQMPRSTFDAQFATAAQELCSGETYAFPVSVTGSAKYPVTYTFELYNDASFTTLISKETVVGERHGDNIAATDYYRKAVTLPDPKENKRYGLKMFAVDADGYANKTAETSFIVYTIPTITLDDQGKQISLCDRRGEVKLHLTVNNGAADYKLFYRHDKVNKTETLTSSSYNLSLTTGGQFFVDSIVDTHKCRSRYGKEMTVMIKGDIPGIQLTTTDTLQCKGSTIELGANLQNAGAADFPVTMYYKLDGIKSTFSFDNDATKFITEAIADNSTLTYTIDSIVSKRGCKHVSGLERDVSNYTEGIPTLAFGAIPTTFCEGTTAQIPVTITGGRADYQLKYTVGGVDSVTTFTAGGAANLLIGAAGNVVMSAISDMNGCSSTVTKTFALAKNDKPNFQISNEESSSSICSTTEGWTMKIVVDITKGRKNFSLQYTIDGELQTAISNISSNKATFVPARVGKYKIASVTDANGCIATGDEMAALNMKDSLVVDTLPLHLQIDGTQSVCGSGNAEIALDFSGTDWNRIVGGVIVAYQFTGEGIEDPEMRDTTLTKEQAMALGDNAPKLSASVPGIYQIVGVADQRMNTNSNFCAGLIPGVGDLTMLEVNKKPVVEIDSSDFATWKDSTYVFNVKDAAPASFDYIWKLNGTENPALKNQATVTAQMGIIDMEYVLIGQSKASPSCYNTDTVRVFLIPDAPKIEIDTAVNDRNKITLHWPAVGGADTYTVWARKWDPYCQTTENGGVYQAKATDITALEWTENSMDTLEFYYITSGRKVGDKIFKSLASDTVGYMVNEVKFTEFGGLNWVSYPFDMKDKGIVTAGDFLEKLVGSKKYFLHDYDFHSQAYSVVYFNPGDPDFGELPVWENDVPMVAGKAYYIEVETAKKYTVYGKLPAKLQYHLKVSDKGNINVGFLPFHYAHLKTTGDVLNHLQNRLFIYFWDVDNQIWGVSSYNPGDPDFGELPSVTNSLNIRPGTPLQFDMIEEMEWK